MDAKGIVQELMGSSDHIAWWRYRTRAVWAGILFRDLLRWGGFGKLGHIRCSGSWAS